MKTQAAEVVVVGGGVIGASISFHLTRSGLKDLVLLEKESLACGATGICPGGIRQQFEGRADCILARRSMSFWNEINTILEPDEDFRFERSGYLFLADSEDMLERYRANVALQNELGIPSRMLSRGDIGTLLPELITDSIRGGSFCDEDGFLEDCHGVTNWLARRACDRGARIQYREALSLKRTRAGWKIETSDGSLECRTVVIAAGTDTVDLAATTGLRLPIGKEVRRLAFTVPHPEIVMPPLVVAPERSFAGKQLLNGVFYLGWLAEDPQLDDLQFIEESLRAGAGLLPIFGDIPVRRVLRGAYDSTSDCRPVLGGTDLEGLFLAVGFSGHGFMIAPAVGEMLASQILSRPCDLPMAPFSIDRFSKDTQREGLVI